MVPVLDWKPLAGQRWPFKNMSDDHVIEEWSVFLPNFIFLVYYLVFNFFVEFLEC
jgi:hypothetical protein